MHAIDAPGPEGELLRCRARLPPGPWATVLDALCAHYPALDRSLWRARMAAGEVRGADDAPIDESTPFRAGQPVYYWRRFHEPRIPVEESIVHVDDQLVVVDKPHFLPVIPAGRYRRETLVARVVARLGNPDLSPLHRLDRGTAGLVLFSADRRTRARYQALFRERAIDKRYEALAPALPGLGFPLERRTRLERDPDGFRMREVDGEPNTCTRIEVEERGPRLWRYALHPVTGRMHQLRVHLAALGAPIHDDPWYPHAEPAGEDDLARPLRLLARALAFVDPLDGRPRRFESTRVLAPG
jgi:tRNA pseudouridine32 synthase/23S rRNA pseudouridine746 synthase